MKPIANALAMGLFAASLTLGMLAAIAWSFGGPNRR